MGVTSVEHDYESLTLTLIADLAAPVDRVWQLWADPRQLERWWGPPGYPATFEQHDFVPGGKVAYYMTSPEGQKYRGWWQVTSLNPPSSLEFIDGFADEAGNPAPNMPVSTVRMQLIEQEGGTRMELRSTYASREALDKVLEMGAEEGSRQAVGQMDALLAA